MNGLPVFLDMPGLPGTEDERNAVLRSPEIKKIICFVLAPAEANIPQACRLWIERVGIADKTEIRYGRVPEEYIATALEVKDAVAIFWTCAVFAREHMVFFRNADTLPFFVQQTMRLDEMQLAVAPKLASCGILPIWRVASHVSPAPLVDTLVKKGCVVLDASSNGTAAQMCADGDVELCITTESARRQNGLVTVHSFGSPEMVFFGGITSVGAEMIASAHQQMQKISVAV